METSILDTIKKMLNVLVTETSFDEEIMVHINSVFMFLNQLGIGPTDVFSIEDSSAVWGDFLTDLEMYQAIKTYIYLKVRLLFDPPGTSFHLSAIENQIRELEWRLNVQIPIPPEPVPPVDP